MGIFDRIKFKKDDKGAMVDKPEKSGVSQAEDVTKEVEKAGKLMPVVEGGKTPMQKDGVKSFSQVILRPVITEKSAHLASENTYVFVVTSQATRVDVKRAIKSMYKVLPVSVRIMNKRGKAVRFGRRLGKRKDWKKAIVSLPKGTSINVYEGV